LLFLQLALPRKNDPKCKLNAKSGYFTFESGNIFLPPSKRRPFETDRRLLRVPLTLHKLAANNVEEQEIVLGVRPEHIVLEKGIPGKVDVSELMGSSVHLHVSSMGRDVVMVVSTMNMTGAEVAALTNGANVEFNFPGHCCHVFNKETGINLEA